jgi:hypothetical protein
MVKEQIIEQLTKVMVTKLFELVANQPKFGRTDIILQGLLLQLAETFPKQKRMPSIPPTNP